MLRSTEEFPTFIETFWATSTIVISTNLQQNYRVLHCIHARGLLRSDIFIPEVKAIGQTHFLLSHTLVLILPPFLMTFRMVAWTKEKGLEEA